jgi:hypothetical protein
MEKINLRTVEVKKKQGKIIVAVSILLLSAILLFFGLDEIYRFVVDTWDWMAFYLAPLF